VNDMFLKAALIKRKGNNPTRAPYSYSFIFRRCCTV